MKPENQMQIHFGDQPLSRHLPQRQTTRLDRARWWFRRMHEVVEQAVDWQPVPPPRPEQTYLELQRPDYRKAA